MAKTNVELVTELMEFSKNGVIMQVFIIEAMYSYAKFVIEDDSEWVNGLISKELWKSCAEEIISTIKNRE